MLFLVQHNPATSLQTNKTEKRQVQNPLRSQQVTVSQT